MSPHSEVDSKLMSSLSEGILRACFVSEAFISAFRFGRFFRTVCLSGVVVGLELLWYYGVQKNLYHNFIKSSLSESLIGIRNRDLWFSTMLLTQCKAEESPIIWQLRCRRRWAHFRR